MEIDQEVVSLNSVEEQISIDLPPLAPGEVDLSGDRGVIKTVLVEGSGEFPQKGNKCIVHYTGTLESDGSKFDSSLDRGDPFSFDLGQGSVIKAWDLAVATMKIGEKCRIVARSDYAYGDSGSPPKIPAHATLVFEIELLEIDRSKKRWQMNMDEKMEEASQRKEVGNGQFRQGDFEDALRTYESAYEYVDHLYKDEDKARARDLQISLLGNQAACLLQLKRFGDVIKKCDKQLGLDANNFKARYRKVSALIGNAEFEEARSVIQETFLLISDDDEATRNTFEIELQRVEYEMAELRKRQNVMYRKMFSAISSEQSEEQNERTSMEIDDEPSSVQEVEA